MSTSAADHIEQLVNKGVYVSAVVQAQQNVLDTLRLAECAANSIATCVRPTAPSAQTHQPTATPHNLSPDEVNAMQSSAHAFLSAMSHTTNNVRQRLALHEGRLTRASGRMRALSDLSRELRHVLGDPNDAPACASSTFITTLRQTLRAARADRQQQNEELMALIQSACDNGKCIVACDRVTNITIDSVPLQQDITRAAVDAVDAIIRAASLEATSVRRHRAALIDAMDGWMRGHAAAYGH